MSEMMKKPSAEVHAMIAQRKCQPMSEKFFSGIWGNGILKG